MRSHLRYDAALHLAFSAGAKGVQGRVAVQVREGWWRGVIGGCASRLAGWVVLQRIAAPGYDGAMPVLPAI
jgi:hypothetical protein